MTKPVLLSTSVQNTVCTLTRWFGVWLDWIVVIYVAVVVYSFLVLGGDILGGEVMTKPVLLRASVQCVCAGWSGHLQLHPAHGDAAVGCEAKCRGEKKRKFNIFP